ncbi:polymer-forming cytoskeletal protein [Mucilaginibacter sp. UR6-11]|uniref:bactofilin family protein n=1 Tax=Mucilaginibacter sp. UR6-11 TaxID=1435644 RepID=UPI001E628D3B|nr:polymer-forming cytoskeletal protein [Mucilaginibacter sp. UR6-11]MCC8424414.1 polymer-forming cytoskeletal protein [Mucilaginibacter sp. UR6-11]
MLNIFKKEIPVLVEPISNIRDLVHDGNDYFSDEFIILDEKLTGNLFCAEKVVVELRGILKGNITSKTCLVTGTVNGDILSLDLLDIKATAVVRGNIQSAKVNIEPGAVINGYITVGEDIEALTEQWNKTKFSTDDYLTTKLHQELSTLTQISAARPVIEQKIEPAPAAVTKQETNAKPEPVAATAGPKSLIAATSPKEETEEQAPVAKSTVTAAAPPKKDEEINNSRWW